MLHIFKARNRVSKSWLMAELCFYRFVHFDCVPIYIFDFHHKQCASDWKDFTSVKFTSQLLSSTGHVPFIHITPVEKSVLHIFKARHRVSKSWLMADLCFYRLVHFVHIYIYIYTEELESFCQNVEEFP